jgi:hypothetical protein
LPAEQPLNTVGRVVRRISGAQHLRPGSRLFHDLSIAGDDAAELLDELMRECGASFEGFVFGDYFPSEGEAFFAHHLRRFVGGKWKPLTIEHLAEVVRRGRWFEPAPEGVWTGLAKVSVWIGFAIAGAGLIVVWFKPVVGGFVILLGLVFAARASTLMDHWNPPRWR